MNQATRPLVVLVLLVLASGCNLLNTADPENTVGRGAKAFDPYTGTDAIRLSLQSIKGCSVLATGQAVMSGVPGLPYPAECPFVVDPTVNVPPDGTMTLIADRSYFIDQLTLVDFAINAHNDPADPGAMLGWAKRGSMFRDLDWSGVGVTLDETMPNAIGLWDREVQYGQAAWQRDRESTFLLEVLDADGQVRQNATFKRSDFLAENPTSGHTRVAWRIEGILPPKYPSDTAIYNPPMFPPTYRSIVKVELQTSANPFNSFKLTPYVGQGALRLTWSAMPNRPFIFPVQFQLEDALPATCFNDAGTGPVRCSLGLVPEVKLSPPANGEYYEPGDTFSMHIRARDSAGNLLHPLEELPSFNDYLQGRANGLLFVNDFFNQMMIERDSSSAYKVVGPLHKLVTRSDVSTPPSYFAFPAQVGGEDAIELLIPGLAAQGVVPGLGDAKFPTRQLITLPPDAEPGTYVAQVKMHRQFNGERISRMGTATFNVGTKTNTSYPNRVGNCQICHRAVLSLENVRHGQSVDHVEGCKACHSNVSSNWLRTVHQIHGRSEKFPFPKNNCSLCHLTKQSATRPSIEVCSACHLSMHSNKFFSEEFSVSGDVTRYGNCAEACHEKTTPSQHILPAN